MPRRGDIAICSAGFLGLILSEEPIAVTYSDGNIGQAWTGVHIQDRHDREVRAGSPWSSRNPQVIANVVDLLADSADRLSSNITWISDALLIYFMNHQKAPEAEIYQQFIRDKAKSYGHLSS